MFKKIYAKWKNYYYHWDMQLFLHFTAVLLITSHTIEPKKKHTLRKTDH